MCGIAGIINLKGESILQKDLKGMTNVLSHRGPDGEGQWIEGNVGIGHRRLSIIDLTSAGQQPMLSLDNRYVLSYNGEIYNYKELRIELQAEGFHFKSNTDSEVILYSLIHWGIDALIKFNGMFAFSLWDRQEKMLLLGRDRYGIKPLYFCNDDKFFSFGSEQKAITSLPHFSKNLNLKSLYEYFTFQNLFTNQTLFKNINILPAGHFLKLNINESTTPRIYEYWDYDFHEQFSHKDDIQYVEELDSLFKKAVKRQLISDVELGAYLSGGMDSGSITAIASENLPNLKTFTCGFDLSSASGIELTFDERIKAESMSARFKTEHYEMVLKAGDMERSLSPLTYHLEEPRVGQSYPNYFASKLTSKFVKVVLSGIGGDELFCGYPWRYFKTVNYQNFDQFVEGYYKYWQRLASNEELLKMFKHVHNEISDVSTFEIFKNVFKKGTDLIKKPEEFINQSLYFEAKTFLHGLFVVEDKLSMAHSLETRVPFMDNDLVNFAMRCPIYLKLNNISNNIKIDENDNSTRKQERYFLETNDGKKILRKVMKQYIPDEILNAKKQGFSSPDASWFKGESIDFVKSIIKNPKARIYEVLDNKTINNLVDEHLEGKNNRRLLIWSLLNVNNWLEQNL